MYDAVYGLEYAPLTSTHATFMAGSVFLLAARHAATSPNLPTRPSLFNLERCSQALAKISTTWADSHKAILEALRDRWVPPTPLAPVMAPATAAIPLPPAQPLPLKLPSSPASFGGGSPGLGGQADNYWLTICAGLSQEPDFGQRPGHTWGKPDEEYVPTAASLGVSFGPPGGGGGGGVLEFGSGPAVQGFGFLAGF